jgi:hypothetical protein
MPVLDMIPTIELPPATPLTLHVTLCTGSPALVTVAENTCEFPGTTVAEAGEIFTTTSLVIATVADAVAFESACENAVTVTLGGTGRICGAVYCPLALIEPTCAFPPATPFTVHVTAVFELPLTVASKVTLSPSRTEALVGLIFTATLEEVVPPPTEPVHAAIIKDNPIAMSGATATLLAR